MARKQIFGSELSAAQQASGLTVGAFCKRQGISEGTFYRWKRTPSRAKPKRGARPALRGFVRLQVPMPQGNASGYEIRKGQTTICLPADFSPKRVSALLALLPS